MKTIFNTEITRNNPTPIPTNIIKNVLFNTLPTCSARTDKSGSAIVVRTPMIKQTTTKTIIFFDFVKPEPICSPIGDNAISAPRLNILMPIINAMAEIINVTNSMVLKLTKGVKLIKITNTVTGITDIRDSFILFHNSFKITINSFHLIIRIFYHKQNM